MRPHRIISTIALLAGLSALVALAQTIDISGSWNFSVNVGESHREPVFSFTQKGETLTGTVARPNGPQKVTGTVRDGKVVFWFEDVRDGEPFKAVYTGSIESATRMTGTVDFSGVVAGSGTWTAMKK